MNTFSAIGSAVDALHESVTVFLRNVEFPLISSNGVCEVWHDLNLIWKLPKNILIKPEIVRKQKSSYVLFLVRFLYIIIFHLNVPKFCNHIIKKYI